MTIDLFVADPLLCQAPNAGAGEWFHTEALKYNDARPTPRIAKLRWVRSWSSFR
jgi:hypothetical protein